MPELRTRIFCDPFSSSFCFSGQKLPSYIIFRTLTQTLVIISPPTCLLHVTRGHDSYLGVTHTVQVMTLHSSMPPTQFTWYFHRGCPLPVYLKHQALLLLCLFPVSKLLLPCYPRSFHGISTRKHLHPVCLRYQVYFLLFFIPNVEIQLLHRHIKGIFKSISNIF